MIKRHFTNGAVLLIVLYMGLAACQSPVETAQQAPAQTPPSDADVKAAIKRYVEEDVALKGGFFLKDPTTDQVQVLSFDHVHEAVNEVEDGRYYACVDFKDTAGNIYDVDIYLKGTATELKPDNLIVHKINGEEVNP
ncbi:hypothetical protein MYX82_10165 [Acidobacteria bacterium AH-259-D05]|nr:hypothetical protein [Acidobacteria bacterium AH-259-D05]